MTKYDASFSVSRLVETLMEEKQSNNNKKKKTYRKENNGVEIHKMLGFEIEGLYENFFEYNGKVYRIYGSPDRLDKKNKIVEELKTYKLEENFEPQKTRGRYQLIMYCYLVGYNRAKLYLYNVPEARYVEILRFYVDKEEQIKTIRKAIEKILKKKDLK